RENDND
ncbi:ubiquitin-conjugating enzyme, partial [Nannochloropsis oceanica]